MFIFLGGQTRSSYDSSCTHVIHTGRLGDGGKEVRLARQANVPIVSPVWLQQCKAANKRVPEKQYPRCKKKRIKE